MGQFDVREKIINPKDNELLRILLLEVISKIGFGKGTPFSRLRKNLRLRVIPCL
jgi:hypothetical protein